MTEYPLWMLPVAAMGGVSFAFLGVGYRLGQNRGIGTEPIAAVAGLAGASLFFIEAGPDSIFDAPYGVMLLAMFIGALQYLLVKAMKVALKHGSLSPLWCAVSLAFVPVVFFAHFVYAEHLRLLHYIGLAAAVACVWLGSVANNAPSGDIESRIADRRKAITYAFILLFILVLNSTAGMAVKYMGMTQAPEGVSLMARYGGPYLFWFYFGFALCLWLDVLAQKMKSVNRNYRYALLCGLISGAGSIGGMTATRICVSMPAAALFTILSITSILVAAFIGAQFFGERRSPAWYGMLAAGVAAILLFNVTELAQRANRQPVEDMMADASATINTPADIDYAEMPTK